MEVAKDTVGKALVIRFGATLEGSNVKGEIELDIDNNYILTEVIEKDIAAGKKNIVLDLTNISYIDSSGLGAIFDCYKQVTENGGNIVLLRPSADVKRVLDITQISKKIRIFDDEKAAGDSF